MKVSVNLKRRKMMCLNFKRKTFLNVLFSFFSVFGLCFLLLSAEGCGRYSAPEIPKEESPVNVPERAVSLSPALTEMMYSLHLEEHLVGVTQHCKYPPEAQEKTAIGTLFEPNLEIMASLHPDCVLMNCQSPEYEAVFQRLGWRVEALGDKNVEDVFAGIRRLGVLFQVPERAEKLTSELKKRLEALRVSTQNSPRKRVLLVLSRNYESPQLEEMYITGRDGLCEPLLEAAGGMNVYDGMSAFPKVTPEGIHTMNPDVILEIIPDRIRENMSDEELDRAWKTLPIPAVKNGNVRRLTESEAALIPGPSMVRWAEKAAEKINN